jgi:CRISPR-associated protein Csd1
MTQDDPEEELLLAMEALRQGKHPREFATDSRFYVLGLAGNSARIAVRFWQVDSIAAVADRIGAHYQDLDLQPRGPRDAEFPSASQLLRETALLGKSENIAPTLSAAFLRSVLNGGAYPQGLLSTVLRRIRSDGRVSYLRVALVKAIVNRQARLTGKGKEVDVKLNQESTDIPYRLGRLFAALERIQQDANPSIKATIKDRYFGAASASPATVFGQLLRLSQHHIQKADKRPYHEKLIQDVVGEIEGFPNQLSLQEQGRFALGYYHQRQWFYTKKEERGGTE